MQPCRERDKGFEIEDANLLILKWGLRTGLNCHNDDDKSTIIIIMRVDALLLIMSKFGVSELYRLAAVGCQMSPRQNTENRARRPA